MAETSPSELRADYVIDQGFDADADEHRTICRVLFVAPSGPSPGCVAGQIAAGSGVITDVPAGAKYGGYPAVPVRDWHRQSISLNRLIEKKGSSDG